MNKSLVAVGVIVALGVVWTGGAWYTGKKIETHLEDMVAQANAQLKLTAPESNLEVSYQNYHRGVFSSQLQLLVKLGKKIRGLKAVRASSSTNRLIMVPSRLPSLKN